MWAPWRHENGAGEAIRPRDLRRLLEEGARSSPEEARRIVERALELEGLSCLDVATLLACEDPAVVQSMFAAASRIKDAIYGRRLVLFAPLYYTNRCVNNCLYCGFRRDNPAPRRTLTLEEVARETRLLVEQGHKRVLVIGGEDSGGTDHLLDVIRTVYETRSGRGEIRRVNVETAPLDARGFARLRTAGIGTYVVFQETYDPEVYALMHPSGPKADYGWRLETMDRAMAAGLGDVGIGALFGLGDWRFEVLGLLSHARHLEERFGAGPHTISVPRLEPAQGAPAALAPPAPVSDDDFLKLVAILRMAVPYTGIILSTREPAELRTRLYDLGVSQISAGSRTDPGGYSAGAASTAQFAIGDSRTLDEVIADIARHGYVPSFCTGCYRLGRTGKDFMDLARPGLIREHCLPNALVTFQEYLSDYASEATRELGERVIGEQVAREVTRSSRRRVRAMIERVRSGERDLYV